MSPFELELDHAPARPERVPVSRTDLDLLLSSQIIVAWAGEKGEESRLGWWRSDLFSEFGGQDLFKRLLPSTWDWAMLQSLREVARRHDAELRAQDHDPDRILSLFSLGFEIDERAEERLMDLKRAGGNPVQALPGLEDIYEAPWSADWFLQWVSGHHASEFTPVPIGRRLKGNPPSALGELVHRLVGGLAPLAERYPLPHYRRAA